MTKQEILEKLKEDLETQGRSEETVRNYCMHVRLYQEYHGRAADEMEEAEINRYIHYLLKEKDLRNRSLPDIPSKEELGYIFYLLKPLKYKALFMTIYGSGLRISEALNLKVIDIDSKNMRIFVRSGKGGRDRYALLPQKMLEILRRYSKEFRPTGWLFVDEKGKQIQVRAAQDAFKSVIRKGETR